MATTQGIKLDEDIRIRLKALAAAKKRTPHWLMRTAIEDYLKKEEQYEKEKAEDAERWEHYIITGKFIENEKVLAWLKDLSEGRPRKWQK
jgi:predicted transcriptional regulator